MSAYMLDKTHIDLIVHLALYGPSGAPVNPGASWYRPHFGNPAKRVEYENLNEVGQLLVTENLRSIQFRYPDTVSNPENAPGPSEAYWLEPYTYSDPRYRLTPIEGLKAIACYEYQSCEHPEWKDSNAKQFIDALRNSLIERVAGFDKAPWEWILDDTAPKRESTTWSLKSTHALSR